MERQKTVLECMCSSVTEANPGEVDMADSSDFSEAVLLLTPWQTEVTVLILK